MCLLLSFHVYIQGVPRVKVNTAGYYYSSNSKSKMFYGNMLLTLWFRSCRQFKFLYKNRFFASSVKMVRFRGLTYIIIKL